MLGAAVLVLLAAAVRLAARGGSHGALQGTSTSASASVPASPSTSAPASSTVATRRLTSVRATDLGALLPAALVGTAAVTGNDGRIYLFGGSGPAGWNAAILAFDPSTGTMRTVGRLPQGMHDAGAAWDGTRALVCGGGRTVGSADVLAFVPAAGGTAAPVGRLPDPLSDLGGVTVDGHPYCLGGWTGQTYSDAVFDVGGLSGTGAPASVAARLPHAVRYAAAAALSGGVLVAGGRTASGALTDAIQWVPLGSGARGRSPAQVGRLPAPTAYAVAAAIDDQVVLAGGCDPSDTPVATIVALDAAGDAVRVGSLPQAVCYGSAASAAGAVYVFGGRTGSVDATASAHVWKLAAVVGP